VTDNVANKCNNVWMFEKKTQLASVSVRFNSQLRVWVAGLGPMREGSNRYIVPGPDSYGGA